MPADSWRLFVFDLPQQSRESYVQFLSVRDPQGRRYYPVKSAHGGAQKKVELPLRLMVVGATATVPSNVRCRNLSLSVSIKIASTNPGHDAKVTVEDTEDHSDSFRVKLFGTVFPDGRNGCQPVTGLSDAESKNLRREVIKDEDLSPTV